MVARQRFFLSTVLSVVLGIALAGLALLISKSNSKPLDLTENRRYTLADQSQQAVNQLKEPVKVWAFVDEVNKGAKKQAEDLLSRYQKVAPSKFSFEIQDPERSPMLASRFQIKIPGPAVVEVQQADKTKAARYERVNVLNEDELTNALLKLNRNQEMKVYSLAGHGERSMDPSAKDAMGGFKADLAKEGFILEELNLAKTPELPADCKVIIVAGPRSELLPGEETRLTDFIKKQGRLLLMLDPESPAGYARLVKQWGLDLPSELIIDPASQLIGKADPIYALALMLDPEHPITKSLRVNLEFRMARPVLKAADVPKDYKVTQLAATAEKAFVVPADVISKGALDLPARPEQRSVPLAQAVAIPKDGEAPPPPDPTKPDELPPEKPEARIVVVGDSDFVDNQMLKNSGNRDFALNSINWLAQTENQISIRPRDPKSEPLRLSQGDMSWMLFWHVLAIPFAVAGMGFISVMLRRR